MYYFRNPLKFVPANDGSPKVRTPLNTSCSPKGVHSIELFHWAATYTRVHVLYYSWCCEWWLTFWVLLLRRVPVSCCRWGEREERRVGEWDRTLSQCCSCASCWHQTACEMENKERWCKVLKSNEVSTFKWVPGTLDHTVRHSSQCCIIT